MAIEQHDIDQTETTDAPAVRSLDTIRRDLADIEGRDLTQLTADLETVRRRTRSVLSGYEPGSQAWRAIVDEADADLDREERAAISRLEGMRRNVQNDRQQLASVPYRPNLPADQVTAAETKAASLAARLPTMPPAQVAREIKGAVLFNDAPAMAAWALLSDTLATRFPNTTKVKDEQGRDVYPAQLFGELLRQCEAQTGDRQVIETRAKLEEQLTRLNARIGAIAEARNAHNPTGGVGGVLASYQFGRRGGAEQVRTERRYDPQAVKTRLGSGR